MNIVCIRVSVCCVREGMGNVSVQGTEVEKTQNFLKKP